MASTNTEVGVDQEQGAFPPFQSETFPSQLLWLAITFALFYYLMAKIALPRISSILEVRSDRIEQDLDEASRLRGESDAAIAAYEQELAEARKNAHSIANEAREAAKAEAEGIRAAEEAKLNELLSSAEAEISATKTAAMADVGTIAEDTASAIVEQLIGGKTTKAEIASAVSRAQA